MPGDRRHGRRRLGPNGGGLTFLQYWKVSDIRQRELPLTWPSRGLNAGVGAPKVGCHPGLYRRAVQSSGRAEERRGGGCVGNTTRLSYLRAQGPREGASGCEGEKCGRRGGGGKVRGYGGGRQAASHYGQGESGGAAPARGCDNAGRRLATTFTFPPRRARVSIGALMRTRGHECSRPRARA